MPKNPYPAKESPRRRWRVQALAVAAIFAAAAAPHPTYACGYENPSDLALGMLNWVFPKALHVRAAVWQAEKVGILPPRPANPAKDLFGAGFRRAVASMNGLGDRLNAATPPTGEPPSFSIVIIPAVMWTTYGPTAAGYSVHVHADGPAKGDVVIVTHDKVVRALNDGLLDAVTAESQGLVRFYGPADRQHQVRMTLAGLPAESASHISPVRFNPD